MAFKFEELRVWDISMGLTAEVNVLIKLFRLMNASSYPPKYKERQILLL